MKNRNKTARLPSNKKTEIISEAIRLFAEKGYYATTLDEIASQVGITKAAIYYYFNSKMELMRLIMQLTTSRMNDAIKLADSKLSAEEKLRKFIKYHVQYAAENRDDAKILFEQIDTLPVRTRESIRRKIKEDETALQNILSEGVKNGIFAIDDVKIASYAILGMCNWLYRWYKPDGRLTSQQVSQIMMNILENGYLKQSKPSERTRQH
jgi:AcrR family transcriptional regulator